MAAGGRARAEAAAAAVDELVVMVDGPRGRATLARLLEKSGLGSGRGEAAADLEENWLEVAAAAPAIEAFKAALGGLAEGGVRLPEANKSLALAQAARAVGEVVSVQVIPRPHDDVAVILPKAPAAVPAKK